MILEQKQMIMEQKETINLNLLPPKSKKQKKMRSELLVPRHFPERKHIARAIYENVHEVREFFLWIIL